MTASLLGTFLCWFSASQPACCGSCWDMWSVVRGCSHVDFLLGPLPQGRIPVILSQQSSNGRGAPLMMHLKKIQDQLDGGPDILLSSSSEGCQKNIYFLIKCLLIGSGPLTQEMREEVTLFPVLG